MSTATLDPQEGLFETQVTLEDVNKVIGEQLATDAQLKPTSKFTVVGDGNGFLSRVILVEPEWTETKSEKDPQLPEKFILKITSTLHIKGMVAKGKKDGTHQITKKKEEEMWTHFEETIQKMHNQEVNFYRFARNLDSSVMLTPKYYFGKMTDENNKNKGFIGLEYVENCVVRHVFVNLQPKELYPVLKAIAHLQATVFSMTDEERESLSDQKHLEALGGMLSEDGIKGVFEQTRRIGEEVSKKVDTVAALGKDLVDLGFVKNLNKTLGIERDVLVHGDLWSTNILWKQSGECYDADKIVDYQLLHFGNPAEDLVRFFISTLSGADRRDNWENLLEVFYSYFVEALCGQTPPYTLKQLKESYRLYFVVGALALLPMFGPVVEVKLKSFDEGDKVKYQEIMQEKAGCLLEDVEKWHLYRINKKL